MEAQGDEMVKPKEVKMGLDSIRKEHGSIEASKVGWKGMDIDPEMLSPAQQLLDMEYVHV